VVLDGASEFLELRREPREPDMQSQPVAHPYFD